MIQCKQLASTCGNPTSCASQGAVTVISPAAKLDHQLSRIAALGFKYADVTDNHPGGQLGREFGFSATASLDDNPADLRGMFEQHGLTATSVCAHANLLDASAPSRYGNSEVSKAVKLAAGMGLRDVITTEGEPHTDWGKGLSRQEQIFITVEKLFEPVTLQLATFFVQPGQPISR